MNDATMIIMSAGVGAAFSFSHYLLTAWFGKAEKTDSDIWDAVDKLREPKQECLDFRRRIGKEIDELTSLHADHSKMIEAMGRQMIKLEMGLRWLIKENKGDPSIMDNIT